MVWFFNYVSTLKGFQCYSNHSPQLLNLKNKKQKIATDISNES